MHSQWTLSASKTKVFLISAKVTYPTRTREMSCNKLKITEQMYPKFKMCKYTHGCTCTHGLKQEKSSIFSQENFNNLSTKKFYLNFRNQLFWNNLFVSCKNLHKECSRWGDTFLMSTFSCPIVITFVLLFWTADTFNFYPFKFVHFYKGLLYA